MDAKIVGRIEEDTIAVAEPDALLITAGAGMGVVDSGLPDFRGDKGFWRAYPLFERLGASSVDRANRPGLSAMPST